VDTIDRTPSPNKLYKKYSSILGDSSGSKLVNNNYNHDDSGKFETDLSSIKKIKMNLDTDVKLDLNSKNQIYETITLPDEFYNDKLINTKSRDDFITFKDKLKDYYHKQSLGTLDSNN